MKYLLCLLIAVLAVSAEVEEKNPEENTVDTKRKQIALECIEEVGIDKEVLERFADSHDADDPKQQCLIKCLVGKTSFYDDESGFDDNVFAKYAAKHTSKDETEALQILNDCKTEAQAYKEDKCKFVYEVARCTRTQIPGTELSSRFAVKFDLFQPAFNIIKGWLG